MSDLAQVFYHNKKTRTKADLNKDSFTIWLDGEESDSGPWRDESGLPIARAWLYDDGTVYVTDQNENDVAIGHVVWGDTNPKIAGRASLQILSPNTTYEAGEEIDYVGFARTAFVDGQNLRVVNFVKERPLAARGDYKRPTHPKIRSNEPDDDLPDDM